MYNDFFEVNDVLELEKEAILAEAYAMEELLEMAEMLEAHDIECEFAELIESAVLTADVNPVSETAVEIREQLLEALKQIA